MLWILLAILLAAAAAFAILQFAVLHHPMPDLSDPRVLRMTKWKKYAAQIAQGAAWVRSHEKEQWYAQSFDGLRLHAQFVAHENAKGTVLLMHGYRSSYVLDFSCALESYHQKGYNLLICDQRAHNQSQGRVITFGVKERKDVQIWADLLAERLGETDPVFLCGLSMGASSVLMAADLPFKANVRGIIADCGFTSPRAIFTHVAKNRMHMPAKIAIPLLGWLCKTFCKFDIDGCSAPEALAKTHLPVVFVHGKADTFVPPQMSQENYAACKGEKHLLLVEDAAHGMAYLKDPEGYEKLVGEFLEKYTGLLPCDTH